MPRIARILCPIDFSDASAHAVEQAAAIARWSGGTLAVLNVERPIFMPAPALPAPCDGISDVGLVTVRERMTAFVQAVCAERVATTAIVTLLMP